MTFNNNISGNSHRSVSLPEQNTSTIVVSPMGDIQTVATTTEVMSTNTPSSDTQTVNAKRLETVISVYQCTFKYFNSEIKKITTKMDETLANPKVETSKYLADLQQLADKASRFTSEIASTIEELEAQLIQAEESQDKNTLTQIISSFKALSETIQTALLQCQEHIQERTIQEQAFADIANNLDTHKFMAEGFSSTLTYLSNEFIYLLGNSEELGTQVQAKWRKLAEEEKGLCQQIKTYMKAMANEIYTTDEQIQIDIGGNASNVRRQLVKIYNDIQDTLKRADRDRFPALSPTEHAAYLNESYQYYMEQHNSLMRRVKNLETKLLSLTCDELIDETARQAQLSLLRGERVLISREAQRIQKRLPSLIQKMEAGIKRDHLVRMSKSLEQIREAVRKTLPDQEITENEKPRFEDFALSEDVELKGILSESEKLKFEGLTSPEYAKLREIPSGRLASTPADAPKSLRFNPNVEVKLFTKYINDEEVETSTSHESISTQGAEGMSHESAEGILHESAEGMSHESSEESIETDMGEYYLGGDIANLDDFADEE